MNTTWEKRRRRIFEILEVGEGDDRISRAYDWLSAILIVLFLVINMLQTFDSIQASYGSLLTVIDVCLVVFFTIEYMLRLWTARYLYPQKTEAGATWKYVHSFSGLVDLFSFLPYYLPVFFPTGIAAFRMIRIIRIFRLFRISKYYDSLNVIGEVLSNKKQQLLSSVFIILVLLLASSLCMYSLEHEAQPEVFRNAFSGIWWSVSTLLTVGYGDIYPVTTLGKFFSILITFLGVGMVAIPTGIISAGFVEQYAEIKKRGEFLAESDVLFVKTRINAGDSWCGKTIQELELPHGLLMAVVLREGRSMVPRGNVLLQEGDILVLGAEPTSDGEEIDLKEVTLSEHNPWVGKQVRELDISRNTLLVMVKRGSEIQIPRGHHVLQAGDRVYVYTENHMPQAETISL